jgi:hypothetical protein
MHVISESLAFFCHFVGAFLLDSVCVFLRLPLPVLFVAAGEKTDFSIFSSPVIGFVSTICCFVLVVAIQRVCNAQVVRWGLRVVSLLFALDALLQLFVVSYPASESKFVAPHVILLMIAFDLRLQQSRLLELILFGASFSCVQLSVASAVGRFWCRLFAFGLFCGGAMVLARDLRALWLDTWMLVLDVSSFVRMAVEAFVRLPLVSHVALVVAGVQQRALVALRFCARAVMATADALSQKLSLVKQRVQSVAVVGLNLLVRLASKVKRLSILVWRTVKFMLHKPCARLLLMAGNFLSRVVATAGSFLQQARSFLSFAWGLTINWLVGPLLRVAASVVQGLQSFLTSCWNLAIALARRVLFLASTWMSSTIQLLQSLVLVCWGLIHSSLAAPLYRLLVIARLVASSITRNVWLFLQSASLVLENGCRVYLVEPVIWLWSRLSISLTEWSVALVNFGSTAWTVARRVSILAWRVLSPQFLPAATMYLMIALAQAVR